MPRKAFTSEWFRYRAVDLVVQGESPQEVAEVLGVSERSVWRWLQVFRDRGEAGLATKPRQGRPPKLTQPMACQVLGWLDRSPSEFGYITERWTAPRVTALIDRILGVRMNHRYVSDGLRRHGISPQVPQRFPSQRDEKVIKPWIATQWPTIVEKTIRRTASLVFTDEIGFLLLPLIHRTLAPVGHTPILLHRARHREKVSVAAALTLSPARRHANLYFQTYPNRYLNGTLYAEFLQRLLWQTRHPLVVVQDQGGLHKGEAIRTLCRAFPRLDLNMLPPYAPDLNPVEQLWNFEKDKELSNFVPNDVNQLDTAIHGHLQRVRRDQPRLRSFFAGTPLPWERLTRLI